LQTIKKILLFLSLQFVVFMTLAQDVPLFTQKLSNSFLYNPSFAGQGFGSVTLAHQSKLAEVRGAGATNFLSVHTPVVRHKFGVGANIFSEELGVLNNLFASAAFAYHLNFGDYKSLSFGVSADYSNIQLNPENIIGYDGNLGELMSGIGGDIVLVDLNQNQDSNLDFSFGLNFQTKHIRLGASLNRLATTFKGNENLDDGSGTPTDPGTDLDLLTNYYTGYVHGMIPIVNGRDQLEPVLTIRQLSTVVDPQYDIGLYYTWNERIILGGAYQTGAGTYYNLTAGYRFKNRVLLGYTYQSASLGELGSLGSRNEFTLRFDFAQQSYQTKFNKYRVQTKSAMAFRRKTLTRQIKSKPASLRQPNKSYHKKYKRGRKDMSPSRRLRYKSKKLKTVKTKRFKTNKRQRQNYKRRKQYYKRRRKG
jgi:type IX secretion system PorP/SprF family membrane protein